jgi:cob(I)alamin adenosyltransferase
MQIYTRTGDDGTTGLFFGGRVRKDDPRPEAYGTVDEAQAAIGWARAMGNQAGADRKLDETLVHAQRDLWVLMAELATLPANEHKLVDGKSRVTAEMVAAIEPLIDDATARFEMPRDFVIPGGTPVAAALDLARTIVRRAERAALAVASSRSHAVPYLNRLSDLLWALARWQEGTSVRAKDV